MERSTYYSRQGGTRDERRGGAGVVGDVRSERCSAGANGGEKRDEPTGKRPKHAERDERRDAGTTRVLTVDVGNTQTNFGLFCDGELVGRRSLTTHRRLTADEALMEARGVFSTFPRGHEDRIYDGAGNATAAGSAAGNHPAAAGSVAAHAAHTGASPLNRGTIAAGSHGDARTQVAPALGAILSCVVPSLTDTWARALRELCGNRPLVVGPGLKTGIRMRYKDPAEVGPDRIADVVAAKETYGAPVMLVDLGTTTNIEVVDKNGVFAGGLIAPGLRLGANALSQAAARLPMIELRAPHSVIGRTTREAMQSGVVFGEVARIDGLLDAVMQELGYEAQVILSGNDAQTMAALLKHETMVDDDLTLRGLWLLWSTNQR